MKKLILSLCLLAAVPATAHAKDWATVQKNAKTTYTIASYTTTGGVLLYSAGNWLDDPSLAAGGALVAWVGTPVMAGSSLRWRRALAEQGSTVSGAAGYATWALWGGSLALGFMAIDNPDLAVLASLAFWGSVITGGVQGWVNGRAEKELVAASAELDQVPDPRHHLVVRVTGSVGRDHAGVGLVGAF